MRGSDYRAFTGTTDFRDSGFGFLKQNGAIFGLQVFTVWRIAIITIGGLRDLATIWVRMTGLKNPIRQSPIRLFWMGVVYAERSLTRRKHGPRFNPCTLKIGNKPFQSTLIGNKRKRMSFFFKKKNKCYHFREEHHSILRYFSNSTVFVCTKLGWRVSHHVITLPFCTQSRNKWAITDLPQPLFQSEAKCEAIKTKIFCYYQATDLFSLYVLFSQYRPVIIL